MHTGEEGHTPYYPSKDFKKFGHKNSIGHEKEDPLDFLTTQSNPLPPSKEFENVCAYLIQNHTITN
jgi:hypothetical protein